MISDVVLVAGIAAVTSMVTVLVPSILIYKTKLKVDQTAEKVDDVSHRMDGRLDQVLELSKKVAFAAGVKQEQDKNSD